MPRWIQSWMSFLNVVGEHSLLLQNSGLQNSRLRTIGWGTGLFLALTLAMAAIPTKPDAGVAQPRPALDFYCQQSPQEIARKAELRQQSLSSNTAWADYTQILSEHRDALVQCRQVRWPKIQGVWLRLYPCDALPGVLDDVFDRIVNLGYNQVYIEVIHDGKSTLPQASSGPWSSLSAKDDLYKLALNAARRRGLSAYAWMFALNFGYDYGQRPDRLGSLARNGSGTTSQRSSAESLDNVNVEDLATSDETFADPFSPQARQDYLALVNQVLLRRPDGVLFDYIRYPRGAGSSTVADSVKDLWIYGDAARQSFIQLGTNPPGQDLLNRYLEQGSLSLGDVQRLDATYGGVQPKWQQPGQSVGPLVVTFTPDPQQNDIQPNTLPTSELQSSGVQSSGVQAELKRTPVSQKPKTPPTPTPLPPAAARLQAWQPQLWQLAVNFAHFGILDFLRTASRPVQTAGLKAGAVFFPGANARVSGGYDARLQPWDRFDPQLEWHAMSYALCPDASCVVKEVQRVLDVAPPGTPVCPAIAGRWRQSLRNRPSLEVQMGLLKERFPQLGCVSHWAYSWVQPESNQARQVCQISQDRIPDPAALQG